MPCIYEAVQNLETHLVIASENIPDNLVVNSMQALAHVPELNYGALADSTDAPIVLETPKQPVATVPSKGRKRPPRNVSRPATAEQLRSQAAYRAMEALMESEAVSPDDMWLVISPLTGRELHEVAQERLLAGKCGNPTCVVIHQTVLPSAPHGRRGQQGAEPPIYCSHICKVAVLELGQRLGSEADALARLRATQLTATSQRQTAAKRPITPPTHSILEAVVQERSVPSYSVEALLDSQAIEAAMDAGFPAVSPARAAALARTVEGYRAPQPRPSRTPASQRRPPLQSILKKPAIVASPVASAAQPTAATRDERAAVQETVTEREPVAGATPVLQQTVQWRSGVESTTPEAFEASGGSQPVLVLEMDDNESDEEGDLRFARLQVKDAKDLIPEPDDLASESIPQEYAGSSHSPERLSDNDDDVGDGDSSISWFSEEEDGTSHRAGQQGDLSTWFRPPPAATQPQLSSFGTLYLLLEAWVSPATRAFVENKGAQATPAPSNAESAARRRAVLTQITRGVASVLQSLHTGVPSSHVESHVQGLLATLNLSAPVPHLKVHEWHLLALLFVKAVALHRVPALLHGSGDNGILTGSQSHLSVEEFHELLVVVCEDT